MSRAGYGRGYYGEGQLAQEPKRKRSWFTVVAVVGVGAAVVWFLWPRNKAVPDFSSFNKEPERSPLPTNTSDMSTQLASAPQFAQLPPAQPTQFAQLPPAQPTQFAQLPPAPPVGAFRKQLEDEAHARHFLTVKDYEDSVVRSAKQLQTAGAKVMLAPHLQHLAPQLES